MKTNARFLAALAALILSCLPTIAWSENEVGFIERFALAPDRGKALGELVPGSEDFYYYHALHYQNCRDTEKLADVMRQWKKRFPDSERRRVIENREALIGYERDPQKTLAYLRERLNLHFNHVQEARDKKPDLPSSLDPKRIARGVFERDALVHDGGLGSLSQQALEELVRRRAPLDEQRRRALLSKLQRPDVPNLVELIAADLKSRESRGFGEFAIHRALLPDQLGALVQAVPSLAASEPFVFTKLRKLAPSADADIEFDAAERGAWLDRVWAFTRTLPPAFNTLKAHALYLRLDHDRKKGVYDRDRFLEYLKLPRSLFYVNPKWLQSYTQTGQPFCDLSASLAEPLLVARPIHNDEPLVRDYFLHLFVAAKADAETDVLLAPWTDYVRDTWLKPLLAEAMIVHGIGQPERWASLLTPADFQRLKERVDIEFLPTNAQFTAPGADVAVDVIVKNTPKLLVKIYEMNALNFFLTQHRQLNTDLNLDGLVANSEQAHTFDVGPFKRVRQTFKFSELKGKRGAWIVEFIGGGRSSRVLVRVGQWQVLQQTGPGGDLLTVFDERGELVKDAVVWLDGRKFTRDEKLGRISVPFTQQPGTRQIIIADLAGTFATLTQFEHHAEDYRLDAQFHVEREQLLALRGATLAVRATLMLGESHLDPAVIQEPKLTLVTTTLDGISTTREVKDLKLSAASELTHTLVVPDRLARLTATLSGKVDVLSAGGTKRDLSVSHTWTLNGMDKTEATSDGHLSKFDGDYVFELLGKNGEPLADQQVVFTLYHREFSRPQTVALKSDDKGRVALGPLAGLSSVRARCPNGRESTWVLDDFERTWQSVVHARSGEDIRVPLPLRSREFSLLETRAGTFVADHTAQVKADGEWLVISRLRAGDYSLRFRDDYCTVTIKVTDGKLHSGWFLGKNRQLQAKDTAPLNITGVSAEKDVVEIRLANASPFTRVHIAASRFEPGRGLFSGLGGFTRYGAAAGVPAKQPNLYAAGREIGDEYRYILERRYGQKFPGNMLTRPGLLLNPWEVRDTGLEELEQKQGEAAGFSRGGRVSAYGGGAQMGKPAQSAAAGGAVAETNLDFLAASAPAIYNLVPDKDGVVRVDRKRLGDRQHVQVYAEDLANAVWRSFALPEAGTKFADLRLAQSLDPVKPFTEKKEITVLTPGQKLAVAGEMEGYDTLGSVHALFTTLSNDASLAKFAWLLQWPKLKDDERRAKYSESACHELNFFLSRKDPAFFGKVVRPYLANKKDKTFMDDYLLGRNLARYREPWAYARLNVVERALLAQREKGEAGSAARHLRELWEMIPPNPDEQDRLFETALRGRALEMESISGAAGVLVKAGSGAMTISGAVSFAGGTVVNAGTLALAPAAAPASPAPMEMGVAPRKSAARRLSLDAKRMDELAEVKQEVAKTPQERELLERAKDRGVALRIAGLADDRDGADKSKAQNLSFFGFEASKHARAEVRAYYRQLGPTKEWAENNYYNLPLDQQNAGLVTVNAFWRDYALWIADGAKAPFVSPHIAEAHRNFTEMMLALAVLDLPFEAARPAKAPVIVYHKQIKLTAPAAAQQAALLVSQSFFRQGDRYREEGNEKFEKYVTEEFLIGVVYGGNVVVTNPTSTPVKAEVLLQIPQGALPVLGSKPTDSRRLRLEPYTTTKLEYYFYFPVTVGRVPDAAAKFPHYPVNVAVAGRSAAAAKPFAFNVVAKLSQVDKASWDYLSQYGSDGDVFAFLEQNNLERLDLARVAWRCRQSVDFFRKLVAFMQAHHVWNETIYSCGVVHNDTPALREWLRHKDDFLAECGPYLACKLLLLDPVERRAYEHLEYSPLVNQRAHRLGNDWRIANPAVHDQYLHLLDILAHKPALDAADSMSVTYYLFLQDRVEESLARFKAIEPKQLPTRIQHDYFRCYAAFYEANLAEARAIAKLYADHPVPRWQKLFAEVASQLNEIEGRTATAKAGDKPDREKQQSELASTEPTFDFKVENKTIALTWKNLGEVAINYYLMDPEFSFSSSPFVSEDASRFSIIKPNKTAAQPLPQGSDKLDVPLPAEFAKANVLVEVVAAGQRRAQPYHANTFKLTLAENYGRLEARDIASDKPVSRAYVKVYARLKNGTVRFFKDGYTDLRGRFDYASMNAPAALNPQPSTGGAEPSPRNGLDYQMLKPAELGAVEKLAILILSDTHGAATREVNPPRE
ncbi:MAG: autotransporter-associated beta strand repeat-containing protein [Verrucomicrobia bacterium]|nr:autotransporter-associated beta strand repeat-containing protein [Verrucomicrobiota bacterium]